MKQPTQKALFDIQPLERTSKMKEALLTEFAWRMVPTEINFSATREISRCCHVPATHIQALVDELVKEGKLVKEPQTMRYNVPTCFLAERLTALLNHPEEYLHRAVDAYSWYNNAYASAIQFFIQKKEKECKEMLRVIYRIDERSKDLTLKLIPLEEWRGLALLLPANMRNEFFGKVYHQYAYQLEEPDYNMLDNLFFDHSPFGNEFKEWAKDTSLFFTHLLPGKTKELEDMKDNNSTDMQLIRAVLMTHRGEYGAATKLFQQILKAEGGRIFNNPYYQIVYEWALSSEGSAASRKKLEGLKKYKNLAENVNQAGAVVLAHHLTGGDVSSLISLYNNQLYNMSNLGVFLYTWIILHFHLGKPTEMQRTLFEKYATRAHLRLLQLESADDIESLTSQRDSLCEEWGIRPLFPVMREMSEWEQYINRLMDRTEMVSSSKTDTAAGTSTARIVYEIQSGRITPRLQKSKDGINWSKGRNIALSTFAKGISEMNDTDRRVAQHVKCYEGGWGTGTYWELEGAEPILELVGYPLVFSTEHPDTPVSIVRDEPQITVSKLRKGGFRMECNFDQSVISKNMLLIRENEYLYRVMTFTKAQLLLLESIKTQYDFPQEAEEMLTRLLTRMSKSLTIHSDLMEGSEALEQRKADSLITALIQPLGDGIRAELFVKPFTETPPYCKPGKGNTSVIGVVEGKRIQAIRNLTAERKNLHEVLEWLQPLSEEQAEDENIFLFEDPYHCLDLLEILGSHTDKIRCEWPQGAQISLKGRADFSNLSLSVKGTNQWFELEGELTLDTGVIIRMADLLAKVRESKGRFIALDEGAFIALSEKLRKQLLTLDAQATKEKGKIKLPVLTAGTLIDAEEQGVKLKKNQAFTTLKKRISDAANKKFTIPTGLKATLRDYQADGFRWMSRLAEWGAGACLADDMGLGKTLQTIALILDRATNGPSLVVAPTSVVTNWKNELQRFAPQLTALPLNRPDCDRESTIRNAGNYDVVITTYGLLVNEEETLAAKEWNIIALDEAHTIKNKETKMSKSAMTLNGKFRLLLTGTPLQNHLGEIWNLFQFATPGLLGSFTQFTERFINPIERNEDKTSQRQLKRILQPFILRRTKDQVLDELPEKTEITLDVELGEEERALYESLRRQAVINLENGESSSIQALAEINRLRQAACHPALIDASIKVPSAKTAAFIKLVNELTRNNHRALVFSQFTSHLSLIRAELDKSKVKYLYLDGSTSIAERNRLVKSFQTGNQPLFLISLKAGGLGLNLTAADYVIHLDPWWNPAIEDQASDRAYRIGQTRPVTVYRLIATQTIEDKIIRLHKTKKSLADSLLDGSDMAHKLTKEEMLELLKEV